MDFQHKSVLFNEVIEYLRPCDGGKYIDGTLGGGGHSLGILEGSSPTGKLYGIDRDYDALSAAGARLAPFSDRVSMVHGNFSEMKELYPELIGQVDGIILDLGVSSYQINESERGFSYTHDAPLDMRMDTTQSYSAYNAVNELSENELRDIIFRYSEEKWAARIAQFIVNERKIKPIETTSELENIILRAVPAGARRDVAHPARRTFQSLRIFVNNEFGETEKGIEAAAEMLNNGGRLCVITFHSLEDHLVKELFRKLENPCVCPKGAPVCTCGRKPWGRILTRKPIVPSEAELEENPRSHSAHLRVFERITSECNSRYR